MDDEKEAPADRARVRRARRRRDPRPVALDADRPQEAAAEGPLDLEALFGRKAPAGRRPRLRQRPVPARQRRLAARPRPPRHRRPAGRHPLRHPARQPARPDATSASPSSTGSDCWSSYVPPGSVAEIHCYHPQPYYDPAQVHRRLITPAFLALVHRSLVPGGLFFVQTDNPGYWRYIREVVPVFFDFHERIGRWPDAPKGADAARDHRPAARPAGLPRLRRRPGRGLSEADAVRLAEAAAAAGLRRRPAPAGAGPARKGRRGRGRGSNCVARIGCGIVANGPTNSATGGIWHVRQRA